MSSPAHDATNIGLCILEPHQRQTRPEPGLEFAAEIASVLIRDARTATGCGSRPPLRRIGVTRTPLVIQRTSGLILRVGVPR